MSYEFLQAETSDGIRTVTLNRPKALNALSSGLLKELTTVIEASRDVRVLVLTGSGEKAFAAGADIAEMRGMSARQAREYSDLGHVCFRMLSTTDSVTIAAINGFALGGGLELAMGCDLLYASDNAKFGQPEVNLGLVTGFGGSQRLSRLIGAQLARELLFTGDLIDAQTAKARGLVVDVFAKDELQAKVRDVAKKILAKGPLAISEMKRLVRVGQDLPIDAANTLEREAFGLLFDTADAKEGLGAFLEKRPATFTGK